MISLLRFSPQSARNTAIFSALTVCIISLLAISGWILHIPMFIQVFSKWVPMQFNTALGLVLISLALILNALSSKKYVKIIIYFITTVVILLGLFTLITYYFKFHLGLDELFIEHYLTTESAYPGRMAPDTALCFILSGIILFGLNANIKVSYKYLLQFPLFLIFILSAIVIYGHLVGISTALGWANLTRMALNTSIAFIIWGCAAFFLVSFQIKKHERIFTQNHFLPLLYFLIISFVFLILFMFLIINQQNSVKMATKDIASQVTAIIETRLQQQQKALKRMAKRIEINTSSSNKWQQDAKTYLVDFPEINLLAVYLSKNQLNQYIATLKEKDKTLLLQKAKKYIQSITENTQKKKIKPTFYSPTTSTIDQRNSWSIYPLKLKNHKTGYLVSSYHFPTILKQAIKPYTTNLINLAIKNKDEQLIFQISDKSNPAIKNEWLSVIPI